MGVQGCQPQLLGTDRKRLQQRSAICRRCASRRPEGMLHLLSDPNHPACGRGTRGGNVGARLQYAQRNARCMLILHPWMQRDGLPRSWGWRCSACLRIGQQSWRTTDNPVRALGKILHDVDKGHERHHRVGSFSMRVNPNGALAPWRALPRPLSTTSFRSTTARI